MLAYWSLDPWIQISMKLQMNFFFSSKENAFENVVYTMAALCLGLNVLTLYLPSCFENIYCAYWNGTLKHKCSMVKFSSLDALGKFITMTSSNGNFFHVTGHLCEEFTGHR